MKKRPLFATIASHPRYTWVIIIYSLVQIIIFKYLYPFPDFISDSYNYIETNQSHLSVNLWPVGYARFIGWIHAISSSATFLVVCQYTLLQAALTYFYFSILYLFSLSRLHKLLLFLFLFINPMFVYLSNCVLSDGLFCSLSLILFTQYLWMLHTPRLYHLVIQTLLIGAAFTVRYTAIYYPLVSLAAIFLASWRLRVKLAGAIAPWLLILPFILYTKEQTRAITGTPEFSVFGGWQIANNALYMYDHITVDSTALPAGTQELDRMTRIYFQKIAPYNPPLATIQGSYFMKMPNAILKPYLFQHASPDAIQNGLQGWGMVSPVFQRYGSWLVKKHPLAFTRYYLWPNTRNYCMPYPEKFGVYNMESLVLWPPALTWFQLKSPIVTLTPSIWFQGDLFYFHPILFLVLNIYFLLCLLFFMSNKQRRYQYPFLTRILLITACFLFVNFCFSVFATPVVLRYQVFPMILLWCFSVILTRNLLHYTPPLPDTAGNSK